MRNGYFHAKTGPEIQRNFFFQSVQKFDNAFIYSLDRKVEIASGGAFKALREVAQDISDFKSYY